MISINVECFNSEMSQKLYNQKIDEVDLNTLECPYCHNHGFVCHGFYGRYVKSTSGKFRLVVKRVKCSSCSHTHALMPSLIVPYRSIQLKDQIRIINDDNVYQLMIDNIDINEIDVWRIKHDFKSYFKQRLISYGLSIDKDIVENSFTYFGRQFMQIGCLCNILKT